MFLNHKRDKIEVGISNRAVKYDLSAYRVFVTNFYSTKIISCIEKICQIFNR